MSKPKVTRRLTALPSIPSGGLALEMALSKARAASILLKADADFLQIPVTLKPGESEKEIRGWIESFAFDALDAALDEAEAARREAFGPPVFGATK